MNYRHVYMLIIEHAKSEEKLGIRSKGNGNYYERHHILPKSLFPLWAKRKSNLVLLTAREHFFCHQLLYKIYPCRSTFFGMYIMTKDKYGKRDIRLTSREFARLRELHVEMLKGSSRSSETRKKMSEKLKGRHMSSIAKQHMSDSKKGKPSNRKGVKLSDETKKKISENSSHHPGVMKGKHLPEETKAKIRKVRKTQVMTNNKKCLCKEDNLIFDSVGALCCYYNITGTTFRRIIIDHQGYFKKLNKTFTYLEDNIEF